MNVKGKQKICITKDYNKNFKSFQGLDGYTLFERYKEIDGVVQNRIDKNYSHFLAQPELDGGTIYWFSVPYYEKPRRLTELQGEERTRYEKIKNETLNKYKIAVAELKSENKFKESKALDGAIKFVKDDFVYCFDGKTVLGVWGMELRDEVRESSGVIIVDSYEPPKKKADVSGPEKGIGYSYQPLFNVIFRGGEHGTINGKDEYSFLKNSGEQVAFHEIPQVEPEAGYEFIGWDKDPNGYVVDGDVVFTARYKKSKFNVVFRSGGHGTINGNDHYLKNDGERVFSEEIPMVVPDTGYVFIGWDKDPDGYEVDADVVFTARYKDAPYNVIFKEGEHGILKGTAGYMKNKGDLVAASEIPVVEPHDGYEFAGWDKNPDGYKVDGDIVFTAVYREAEKKVPVWRWILDLLLLLLLHILIFLLIWCFLFGKCGFNLCGCEDDCGCDEIVETHEYVEEPEVDPNLPVPHTGDIQILLSWSNKNDLDIECTDPFGNTVRYDNKKVPSGGELDIDMNAGWSYVVNPIENIYWPTGGAPKGRYKVRLIYFAKHDSMFETPYTIKVKHGDKTDTYTGTVTRVKENVDICTFVID